MLLLVVGDRCPYCDDIDTASVDDDPTISGIRIRHHGAIRIQQQDEMLPPSSSLSRERPFRRATAAVAVEKSGNDAASVVDLQSDTRRFGRGAMHLSALLEEGDVVAYQTGNWLVDGVPVGDDYVPASMAYCRMETLQVVWTHNCEHGVLRGWELVRAI